MPPGTGAWQPERPLRAPEAEENTSQVTRREEESELRSDWQAEACPTTDGFPERDCATRFIERTPIQNVPQRLTRGAGVSWLGLYIAIHWDCAGVPAN